MLSFLANFISAVLDRKLGGRSYSASKDCQSNKLVNILLADNPVTSNFPLVPKQLSDILNCKDGFIGGLLNKLIVSVLLQY